MFLHLLAGALMLALFLFIVLPAPSRAPWKISPLRRWTVFLGCMVLPLAALAQTGTVTVSPPAEVDVRTIPLAPWVAWLKPYIDLAASTLIPLIVTWAAIRFSQMTGVNLQATAVARLKSAAATSVGAMVAQAEDNLSKKVITVDSPVVAQIADDIVERLPDVMKAAGATPQSLQHIIAGEFGKAQSSQPTPAVPPVTIPVQP